MQTKSVNLVETPSTQKMVKIIYILNFFALIFPLCAVVGVVLAYIFKDDAVGYLQSHFRYLIRSFWVYILYLLVAGLLCFILIGFVLLFITAVWWIIRNAKGLKAALQEKDIINPSTWWF